MIHLTLAFLSLGTSDFPKLEVRNLGISVSSPGLGLPAPQDASAIGATHFAFNVREAQEGGVDLNSDGDVQDEVVHLLDLRSGSIVNLGFEASNSSALAMADSFLVYSTLTEPSGIYRLDLTSGKKTLLSSEHASIHMDQAGWVILRAAPGVAPFHVHDPAGRLVDTLRIGGPITGFENGLAALIPWEGHYRDFNGDHDAVDEVPMFYDVRTRRLVNSGWASYHKQSDAYPEHAPLVGDNWVRLLVSELAQGAADLNGNGNLPTEHSDEQVVVAFSRVTGGVHPLVDAIKITADMGRYFVFATYDGGIDDYPVRILDSLDGTIVDLGVRVETIVQGTSDGCLLVSTEATHDWVLRAGDLSLDSIPKLTVFPDFVGGATPVADRAGLVGSIPEVMEDLNGDGDTDDEVIYWYDYGRGSGTAIPIASSWSDRPSNGVWPFASNESKQHADWNGDGDMDDLVWILVDEGSGAAFNTGLEVGAEFSAGGAFDFLAFSRGSALFRARESVGGLDWNEDGDTDDRVLFEAVLPDR